MEPREVFRNVGRTALILMVSTAFTGVAWFSVWVMYFTNTPILRTLAVEVREPAAAVLVHTATHFLVFWWFWMRGERERDFHPLLVGVVAGVVTALSYDGYEWLTESPRFDTSVAMVVGLGLLVGSSLLLPLLAGQVRFPVPSAPKVDITAYIAVPVLMIAALLVHPSGPTYPGKKHFADRRSWARDQRGGRYEPVERYLRELPLDEFGLNRDFSPTKVIRADDESLRGYWEWRAGDRRGRCYVYMRQEQVDGVFRPAAPEFDNARTAFCFELKTTRVLVFDWQGELVLSYEEEPPKQSLAEYLRGLSL